MLPRKANDKKPAGVLPCPSDRRPEARGRPRLVAAAGLVCAVAVLGTANLSTAARAGTTRSHGTGRSGTTAAVAKNRSGLPWPSGAYMTNATPATAAAFGTWRKRRLDVVEVWLSQSTWTAITNPAWLYRRWEKSPYQMVFSVAMLPTAVRGVSIAACARGAYNAHWRQFGKVISSYGLGSSMIRLGWEFNGKWERWAATNPTQWAQCWRQAVTSARATAPKLRWIWNVNRGPSSALADPTRAYPGNKYVSMVGIDSYDWWRAADAGGWHAQLDGPQGLKYWLAFAKAHGKKLSVPEWGNVRYGTSSGGDDPQYVKGMEAFFAANARYVGFEAIFQGATGNYYKGKEMPESAKAYRAAF